MIRIKINSFVIELPEFRLVIYLESLILHQESKVIKYSPGYHTSQSKGSLSKYDRLPDLT